MTARYGTIYRVADFIERMIPKRGEGKYDTLFVHQAIQFLKKLEALQDENPRLTLAVHAGDSIPLTYNGIRLCHLTPTQKYIRISVYHYDASETRALIKFAIEQSKKNDQFLKMDSPSNWIQWQVSGIGLEALYEYIDALPKPKLLRVDKETPNHPRYFPGGVREAALTLFEQSGRKCQGVEPRKPHVVGKNERIEFDHILPYSRGGVSTAYNIQILCEGCNRLKRDTAR